MKKALIDELVGAGYGMHGCYRGGDGRCYYLCSLASVRDYGERRGCTLQAFVEDNRGKLEVATTFDFAVTRRLLATGRMKRLVGEHSDYIRRAGLARLKAILDQGGNLQSEYKLVLNSEASDVELAIPHGKDTMGLIRDLRGEILRNLAWLHNDGHEQVPRDMLLGRLCTQMDWFDRAIDQLVHQQFLVLSAPIYEQTRPDVFEETRTLALTSAGHLEAEKPIPNVPASPNSAIATRAPSTDMLPFDCFISYASEVRSVVERLILALTARDLRVWWDKGQITIGDTLTRKLDEGLTQSRYGVVIVSTHSIAKKWTDAEVRALARMAINSGTKVVLPVLVGITHEQYAAAYPLLGDLVSATLNENYEELASEIVRAVRR